jgi:hypothetical protein
MLQIHPVIEPVAQAVVEIYDSNLDMSRVRLWLPEAVTTERGFTGFYPQPQEWTRKGNTLSQYVDIENAFGEGNVSEISPGVWECEGILMAKERALPWIANYQFREHQVHFTLTLKNPYDDPVVKAGAAICLKYLDQSWWDDRCCFTVTTEGIRSIADLGRSAGRSNTFQAWLLDGETYNHPFYVQCWGFGTARIKLPVWISYNEYAGYSVVIGCESAYFIHSNSWNPCTDVTLKFGNLEPGESVSRSGFVEYTTKPINQILSEIEDTLSQVKNSHTTAELR